MAAQKSPSKTRLAYKLIEEHSNEFSVRPCADSLGFRELDTMLGSSILYLIELKKMLGFSN